ncbi:hypothetical protein C8J57DRAFT_1484284 [Mycena rebaudengoi]|nr:hypothetical protein C8J57DRAFT_1484284 [Mycena rebaudengoi]
MSLTHPSLPPEPSLLPPELEWKIFEIAATDHPKTIPTLLLVARRVLQWIEPLLYRTLVMGQQNSRLDPAALLRLQPARLKHIRHLLSCNEFTFRDLLRALPLCEGLQTLQVHNMWILAPLQKMQLSVQRVSIIRSEDLRYLSDPSLPPFRTLTHLEMIGGNDVDLNFTQLPALTHLSFYTARPPPSFFHRIANWTTLRVLINKIWVRASWNKRHEHQSTNVDPRCVLMFLSARQSLWVEDWIIGAAGGKDFWARAELFIDKRRRGEIEPGMFLALPRST